MRARKRLFMTLVVALNAFCAWAASAAMSAEVGFNETVLASRADGANGVKGSGRESTISADGRYVAFSSDSPNLDPDDGDFTPDIYVRDLRTNETALVSRASGASGAKSNAGSFSPSISGDGRYVAFSSRATNLDPDDSDGTDDVYLRDLQANTTILISRADGAGGAKGNQESVSPAISADGFYVAFESRASNLDGADTDTQPDVYVRDWSSDLTTLISVGDGLGAKSNGQATAPSISDNGTAVAFASNASNLAGADVDGNWDIFVRRPFELSTTLASRATGSSGVKANGFSADPDLSGDGRSVAFWSQSTNLDPADGDSASDVYVRDLGSATTALASRADGAAGAKGDEFSDLAELSGDGTQVAFQSYATNLDAADDDPALDPLRDIYVRDLTENETVLASRADGGLGTKGNDHSQFPSITADGTTVAFTSNATNLTTADSDPVDDVFVRGVGVRLAKVEAEAVLSPASPADAGGPGSVTADVDFGTTFSSIHRVCFQMIFVGDLFDQGELIAIGSAEPTSHGWGFGQQNVNGPAQREAIMCLQHPGHDAIQDLLDGHQSLAPYAETGSVRIAALKVILEDAVPSSPVGYTIEGPPNSPLPTVAAGNSLELPTTVRDFGDAPAANVTMSGSTNAPDSNVTADPATGTPTFSTVAKLHTSASTTPGFYWVIVTARSGSITRSANIQLEVTEATGDNDPPEFPPDGLPDYIVPATSPDGAELEYEVTATDDVDPDPTVTCTPPSGSLFPIGTTTVHCEATDDAGNTATDDFDVTVEGPEDSDGDGLWDVIEIWLGCDPHDEDTDDDGISDYIEIVIGTDPTAADSDPDDDDPDDGSHLTRIYGHACGCGPEDDEDGDGVATWIELRWGTNPGNPDTDGGGGFGSDVDYIWHLCGCKPVDEDGDGIPTMVKKRWGGGGALEIIRRCGCRPWKKPGGGGGIWVDFRFVGGPYDEPDDPDGDGIDTVIEIWLGCNPFDDDTDGDGLTDDEELTLGTDPTKADTDGDGLNDGLEIELGCDPLDPDSDDDGLEDGEEIDGGTDPLDPDSDDDGVDDGDDNCRLTPNPDQSDVDHDGIGDECDPTPGSTGGCKVTWGGQLTAANGDVGTLAGNAQAKTPAAPKGEVTYVEHGPATPFKFKSASVTSIICSGNRATVRGTGTAGSASVTYRVDLVDNGEPGRTDTSRIRLSNGYDSGEHVIKNGNVQLHKGV